MNTQTKSTLETERLKQQNEKLERLLKSAYKELSAAALVPKNNVDNGLLLQIKKALFANNPS